MELPPAELLRNLVESVVASEAARLIAILTSATVGRLFLSSIQHCLRSSAKCRGKPSGISGRFPLLTTCVCGKERGEYRITFKYNV